MLLHTPSGSDSHWYEQVNIQQNTLQVHDTVQGSSAYLLSTSSNNCNAAQAANNCNAVQAAAFANARQQVQRSRGGG
jgi:hypothetical protein